MFFDWLDLRIHSESMLSQSPGYPRQVRWLPCEDIPVLTEELDELGFLFVVKRYRDVGQSHTGIVGMNVNLLGFADRLKR